MKFFCIAKDQDLLDKFSESNLIRSLHYCIVLHILRDRTDQLNNIVKNLFKEMNDVETILGSFKCS